MGKRHNFEKFDGYTKVQVESFVKMKIETDLNWAKRAVVKLFLLQTKNEQIKHVSTTKDGFGFSKFDAPYFSVLACKLRQQKKLTPIQERKLFKLGRYARQLISVCDRTKLKSALDAYYGVPS